MKKIWKWIVGIVSAPFILFAFLALLLYIPAVQNWAVRQVTAFASEQTGLSISVKRVDLSFPLDLSVSGFKVLQPNDSLPQVKDTVADVRQLVASVQLLPLFKSQVEVDRLELNDVKMNTTNFIHEARVKGNVKQLTLRSHGISLDKQTLRVDRAFLDGAHVDVELSDTVPEDTTKSENFWKIKLDRLDILRSDVTVHLPGDTLQVEAYMGKVAAHDGFFDLYKSDYSLASLDWQEGSVKYDNNFEPRVKGLDYNHIALSCVRMHLDTLHYCAPKLDLSLKQLAFREKSGITVIRLSSKISLDSTKVMLPNLMLATPESSLSANLVMDFNAFEEKNPGKLHVLLDGSFGKQDIMRFMGGMPTEFIRRWPNQSLTVKGAASGNMKRVDITGISLKLPTAFHVFAKGHAENPTDMKKLKARLDVDVKTYNLGFATVLLDKEINRMVNIPSGIGMKGTLVAESEKYMADIVATEGRGVVKAKAMLDLNRMAYDVKLDANRLQLQHFLPHYGLSPFSGTLTAQGCGTDFFSPRTRLAARARVSGFRYAGYDMSGVKANAEIANGNVSAHVDSHTRLFDGTISLNALMSKRIVCGTVACDLRQADLYRLRVVDKPLSAGLCAHIDIDSDLKEYFKVNGFVSSIVLKDSKQYYYPQDLSLDLLTNRDTTTACLTCGDFDLDAHVKGGYENLIKEGNSLWREVSKQMENKYIDQLLLRKHLPTMSLYLKTGKDNAFCKILKRYGYDLANIFVDMNTSPLAGINGKILVDSLVMDSIRIDTIRLNFLSDSTQINYTAQIRNNNKNMYVFNALLDGGLHERGAFVNGKIYDEKDRLGIGLGLKASMEDNGIRLNICNGDPVLGYKRFHVNDSNYVFLGEDKRVKADVQLVADDGTGVRIYSTDNTDALQDLTVGINQLELANITKVIPYLPKISGKMNGDFHLINTADELSVSSSLGISNMVYEGCAMGNIGSEFVYMPKDDGTHYVNGNLVCNDREVGMLEGTYNTVNSSIDAKLDLNRTPLSLVNGFIPQQLIGLKGTGEGTLTVKGNIEKPEIDGEVFLDSAYLVSVPYGVELRFDNDPVRIVGSHLLFENFEMYAHNNSPLTMVGDLDFSNPSRMMLNLKMRAENYQIIDAKENLRSEAFGKAFVNVFALLNGPLDDLSMRGKLDVLGATDMTYVLRDSPLTTDNQLDGLVKFTDLNDSIEEVVNRPAPTGLNMDMTVNVDQAAHIVCALNADQSNYIDLEGGGTLRMQYNTVDGLQLRGRYTLNNGQMKYSLPVIPLKTFTIQDGSYVEFRGDPMNPYLNITALEEVKSSVSSGSGQGRVVMFQCGVVISKTLNDMGLEFVIDAPEDISMHSELQAMSMEDRGKLAVTMLTTGMYLSDGNTKNFTMNSALSAFLQSQINQISGNALRTLDLSFGVDNTTDAAGRMHTDYSFKFAKRFWNNRLRIVVGGKLSTGADVKNQNESFFNNVTFEYRLSDTSNKYIKVFYDRDSYDWLEGNVGEFGAGFMWRRKLLHFKDIFNFRKEKTVLPTLLQQNTQTDSSSVVKTIKQ